MIDKKLCNGVTRGRAFFRVLLKLWIMYTFGNIFLRQGILLGHFDVTGYRAWRDLPHTPVTSLVKYPLGGILDNVWEAKKCMTPPSPVNRECPLRWVCYNFRLSGKSNLAQTYISTMQQLY